MTRGKAPSSMESPSSPENLPTHVGQRSPAKQSGVFAKAALDREKGIDDFVPKEWDVEIATSDEFTDEQATDDSDDALDEKEPEEGDSPLPRVFTQNPEGLRETSMTNKARISTSPSSRRSPGKLSQVFVEAQRCNEEDNEDVGVELEENLSVDNLVLRAAMGERALVDEKIRFLREKGSLLPTRDGGYHDKSMAEQTIQRPEIVRAYRAQAVIDKGKAKCQDFGHDTKRCKHLPKPLENSDWVTVGKGKGAPFVTDGNATPSSSGQQKVVEDSEPEAFAAPSSPGQQKEANDLENENVSPEIESGLLGSVSYDSPVDVDTIRSAIHHKLSQQSVDAMCREGLFARLFDYFVGLLLLCCGCAGPLAGLPLPAVGSLLLLLDCCGYGWLLPFSACFLDCRLGIVDGDGDGAPWGGVPITDRFADRLIDSLIDRFVVVGVGANQVPMMATKSPKSQGKL
ncbi:hypothetical protein U1Q18_033041 [Sarracenia purpurea var. burkii]